MAANFHIKKGTFILALKPTVNDGVLLSDSRTTYQIGEEQIRGKRREINALVTENGNGLVEQVLRKIDCIQDSIVVAASGDREFNNDVKWLLNKKVINHKKNTGKMPDPSQVINKCLETISEVMDWEVYKKVKNTLWSRFIICMVYNGTCTIAQIPLKGEVKMCPVGGYFFIGDVDDNTKQHLEEYLTASSLRTKSLSETVKIGLYCMMMVTLVAEKEAKICGCDATVGGFTEVYTVQNICFELQDMSDYTFRIDERWISGESTISRYCFDDRIEGSRSGLFLDI